MNLPIILESKTKTIWTSTKDALLLLLRLLTVTVIVPNYALGTLPCLPPTGVLHCPAPVGLSELSIQ